MKFYGTSLILSRFKNRLPRRRKEGWAMLQPNITANTESKTIKNDNYLVCLKKCVFEDKLSRSQFD